MAPSRRMQKQGMPDPLDSSIFTKKRKLAQSKPEQPAAKKKKPLSGDARPMKTVQKTTVNVDAPRKPILKVRQKEKKTPAKAPPSTQPLPLDDEFSGVSSSPSADDIDDPDILEDTHNTPATDRLEDAELSASASASDPFDSADEHASTHPWSSASSDAGSTDLNATNIESLSTHLDARAAESAAAAQAELEEAALQTNIADSSIPGLDSFSSSSTDPTAPRLAPDLQLLRTRITDTVRVLDDFAKHKAVTGDTRPRAEYTAQLERDICAYFGYSPFLARKLLALFPAREAFAFFEANESPRPTVIRTNTLKTHRRQLAQSLINRGMSLEPVGKWSKVGLQIFESAVPIGATPEYLAGHYMLQAAASLLPVMALAPQAHEQVLDMAAAPGGKSAHVAALMRNTGTVWANDASRGRAKALIGNLARLGVTNAIVCACAAEGFTWTMWGGFDRVLLDAPCSGTGVISKDASVKTGKGEGDFVRLPERQKRLLLAAIDCVDHASRTGGYVVYSTCSVTVEENEQVVAYALRRRANVKIVETGLPFGREGFVSIGGKVFPEGMRMARRYYPHAFNVDGFFVCKLRKTGPTVRGATGATGPVVNGMSVVGKREETAGEKEVVEGTGEEEEEEEEEEKSMPIEMDGEGKSVAEEESDFGGFSEEEDRELMEKKRRNALRRKGLDPRADKRKAKAKQQTGKGAPTSQHRDEK